MVILWFMGIRNALEVDSKCDFCYKNIIQNNFFLNIFSENRTYITD